MAKKYSQQINQTIGLKKSHKIGVGIFLFVKIILIISVIWLSITLINVKTNLEQEISNLEQEISNLEQEINTKIIENQQQIQSQINELGESLSLTEKDLTEQFNELKAQTDSDFSGIIEQVTPSVVSVRTDISQGSGFIITDNGYIVTNAHVLSGGSYAQVLTLDSLRWKNADLIGYDLDMDIAVLEIPGNYEHLEFADSDNLKVGQKTIAIGNPLGLSFTVTEGIISALDRKGINGIPAYIQIDTPLNPGNSGGPLINTEGEVIGVNNFKIQGGENLGFSLESNYAVETINDIFESKNITTII
jgi:S1-C subfamily serine protease